MGAVAEVHGHFAFKASVVVRRQYNLVHRVILDMYVVPHSSP
jgi:hypothetical protein